jgi:outer membrane usher protein FimD/PapC
MSRSVYLIIALSIMSCPVLSAEQFNTHFIRGNNSVLPDVLKATKDSSGFHAGSYLLDIYFNKEKTGRDTLEVAPGQDQGLCYSEAFLAKHNIALDKTAFAPYFDQALACYRVQDHPDASVELDHTQQALRFKLPQSLIVHDGAALMSLWDHGTHGANLQYSYRGNQSQRNGLTQFAELGGSLNFGRWVLTGRAYKNNSESIVAPEYRLTTAVGALRGDASIGKMPLQASLISGFVFTGAALVSDNQMTPWLSQSYAPVISGIAASAAQITVRQQGYILYSQDVPPGPYAIRNLAGIGSGELEVIVREEDGSETRQVYPVSVLPSLLRPGHVNYSLAAGTPQLEGNGLPSYDGRFVMGAADIGLEAFTVNTSALLDPQYQNLAAGITRSFGSWGAISTSANLSAAQPGSGDELRGYSLAFKYAKNLLQDTNLQIAGYRYASQDYLDYTEYHPDVTGGTGIKNRLEAFMTHRQDKTLYSGSIWRQQDWSGRNGNGASLRASWPIGPASLTTSLNYGVQRSDRYRNSDNLSVGVSVSLPLDYFERRTYSSTSLTAERGGDFSANTSLSGSLSERTRYNLNGGVSQSEPSTYASLTHRHDAAVGSLAISQRSGSSTFSGSLSGAVVQAGNSPPVFTAVRSDTVAVVETRGLQAARFGRSNADADGNAVIALTPYNKNMVKIDASNLAHNIELLETAHSLVPTRRSVHQLAFAHKEIDRYILKVWLGPPSGRAAPFNATAVGPQGQQVGFVTEGGILLYSSDDQPASIALNLPDGTGCAFSTAALVKNLQQIQEVTCE